MCYAIVPVEATPAMLDIGAQENAMNCQRVQSSEADAFAIFGAMLCAAPSPLDDGELVERVAKALCKLEGAKWDAEHFGETMTGNSPQEMQDGYREQACAAIAAIVGNRE